MGVERGAKFGDRAVQITVARAIDREVSVDDGQSAGAEPATRTQRVSMALATPLSEQNI